MNAPKKSDSTEPDPIRYDDPHPRVGSAFPTNPAPQASLGGRPFEGGEEPAHKTVGIVGRLTGDAAGAQ